MKKSKILLIVALALLMTAMAGLWASAKEPPAPDTSFAKESGSTTVPEEQEKPKGFAGVINEYISLCENGGIVCRAFGKVTPALIGGKPGTRVEIHPAVYAGTILLCMAFSYVLGSVNFGIIVSRRLCNGDVREHGSGNSGMTNVLRVYGKKAALLTFLGDAGKAALCAEIGLLLAGNGCGYLALAACMVGHAFPVFFRFKGGKSVAAACGGMLVLEPLAALIIIVFFLIIVLTTKYVSLGSIIGSALLPVMVNTAWQWDLSVHNVHSYDYWIVSVSTVFFACFIIWLHRGNIKRLYNGEERKTTLFGRKKSGDPQNTGKN